MKSARRTSRRLALSVLSVVLAGAFTVPAAAAAAAATKPTTPVPVCSGAKAPVVDVTQDVEHQPFVPGRDGRIWADFTYSQHLRIWSVGGNQYCVRKDVTGTWVSVAGPSPALTGTISDGVTGTLTSTEFWMWTGKLSPIRPTSGYLGTVNADCTTVDTCADDSYLLSQFYWPNGYQHCQIVRAEADVDGGTHGDLRFVINGDVNRVNVTGDITG